MIDIGWPHTPKDTNQEGNGRSKSIEDLDDQILEKDSENDVLNGLEYFIDESDLDFTFKLTDFNRYGVLYLQNEDMDKIVENYLDTFNIIENDKMVLKEDLEKYKSETRYLENRVDEIKNEYEFKRNKYRSITQRFISKFPFMHIIRYMPKTGLKTTLINLRGYQAIKKDNLLDIGYYLTNYPDVKLTGKDPIIHYIYHGFKEGRRPNPSFDGEYYIETHPDVEKSNINPLVHYALYGKEERRNPSQNIGYTPSKSGISAKIDFNRTNLVIEGILMGMGDNYSGEVILKVDNYSFTIKSNTKAKNNEINEGYYFKFNIPAKLIDGKLHRVRLYDPVTHILIYSQKMTFSQPRSFKDLSGFLGNSLVSPIIYAPFREQDKRCFATMEDITKYLITLPGDDGNYPMVSVIMPVYNSIKTLQAAVDSVLSQSYPNIELVVIDGGSDDGSYELLQKVEDENLTVIQNKDCKKVYQARNLGLTAVNGKYVAYHDSDIKWDSRYVAAMVGAFCELPDAETIYSGQLMFTENEKHPFAVRFGSLNRSLLENRNYINLNALCHTRDLYKRIGGFDESLGHFTDWDWILQISKDAQIYSIPILLSHFYCKDHNINNDPEGYYLNLFRKKQVERQKNIKMGLINSSEPLNNNVSIVIPSYESLEDIQECIDSIFELNVHKSLEIIVVDNASSKPVVEYLSQLATEGKIKLIKNDVNYGFTFAVNQGIDIAEPKNDILLINNDANLTPGAVEAMQSAAYKLSDCGIVVPKQVFPMETKTLQDHVPYAYTDYECDVNLSGLFNNMINVPIFHSGRVVELNFAPFFCVYIKREVLDSSVGLDAEFGRHYRSDRIFCNYIRHVMKLKIYHIEEAKVFHKMQKSTEILRESSQKEFDIMFYKNQWNEGLASQFGYKKPFWDF